jgi:hypothetical protein
LPSMPQGWVLIPGPIKKRKMTYLSI